MALASELCDVAAALARVGLRPAAVSACLGGFSAVHAARRRDNVRPTADLLPAAVAPWLFVGGAQLPRVLVRAALGDVSSALERLGLLEFSGGAARAPRALLPLPAGLLASPWDRLPDDSSFHLAGSLPRERAHRWLDVGTGTGFVPLSRPATQADSIVGADIDRESLACAALSMRLRGRDHIAWCVADRASCFAADSFDRITFNAPIPIPRSDVLREFWPQAARCLRPGGAVYAHCVLDRGQLPTTGELTIVRYTPAEHAPGFGVCRWRPDRDTARAVHDVTLSSAAPHAQVDWTALPDPG